jgi:cell division protein FtsI/penicillin-binding protein 2
MFNRRVQLIGLGFAVAFAVLLGQLFRLQVLHGQELRRRGKNRLHRLKQVAPRRGSILDRNGRVLAEDRATWELWLTPARWGRSESGARRVELVLGSLTVERLRDLAHSRGERFTHEYALARDYLRDRLPLTRRLAAVLRRRDEDGAAAGEPPEAARTRVAEALLDAALEAARDESRWGLFEERQLFADIGNRAYLEILEEKRRLGADSIFQPLVLSGGWERVYPLAEAAAHAAGYVGPLTARDYERLRGHWGPDGRVAGEGSIPGFFEPTPVEAEIIRLREVTRNGRAIRVAGHLLNETVGRAGLEREYNQWLRGEHGLRHLRLSRAPGGGPRVMETVGVEAEARPGQTIWTTLDAELQRQVYRLVREKLVDLKAAEARAARAAGRPPRARDYTAACVVMDPRSGAVYALTSLPAYHPAQVRHRYRQYLLPAAQQPLLNRVTAGIYPPGSTFKPVVALGALSAEAIEPETYFECSGWITLGDHDFICMRRYAHGPLDVRNALRVSCNVFFYQAGEALGGRELYAFARALGFGERTGIDLPGEHAGLLPERARTGHGWALGNTYHFSIGQGLAVTPLQLAVAVSAVANGGTLVRPRLLDRISDPTPAQRQRLAALRTPRGQAPVTEEAVQTVREGMRMVVQGNEFGQGGTGARAQLATMEVGGKSGSADWKKGEPTHAWFAAYAPAGDPQVAVVLVIPEGDLGGRTCAPVVRQILQAYFGFEITDREDAVG